MRQLLNLAYMVMGLVLLVTIFIFLNAFLDPGILDPETKSVRFVSDGFKVSFSKNTRTYHSMYESGVCCEAIDMLIHKTVCMSTKNL